jgi:shikimate kinase
MIASIGIGGEIRLTNFFRIPESSGLDSSSADTRQCYRAVLKAAAYLVRKWRRDKGRN